jgi:5,10-methylene-tetrahydrofolate dehydrogenase/methenyl tetrahydrofolate cyclohydrolase
MAATGRKHLINKDVLDTNLEDKILVDIGWWIDEDGAYGDIDRKYYEDKVKAVTPVPGWVWPVTVTCLFHNIMTIWEQKDLINL